MASASGPLHDHLGSTAVTANTSGAKTGELRYHPYGSTRSTWGTTPTTYRFTGQREERTIGLYFYNARWYDPVLGRFIQPDPLVPEPGNPQALNRYAYVYNNPLRYIDADGHLPIIPLLIVGGIIALKAIDYGWTAWDSYQSLKVINDPNASEADKATATANLALTAAFEAAEPDDLLPVALPLDDLARLGVIGSIKQVGREAVERTIPLGFKNADEFAQFGARLKEGLKSAGYEDVRAIFQGSSVTGVKYTTGAPFDAGRVSDFDIALASPTLLQRAKELGIGLRSGGTRTGPIKDVEILKKLGLYELSKELSTLAGRPVYFMIYESADDAIKRSPSIIVP